MKHISRKFHMKNNPIQVLLKKSLNQQDIRVKAFFLDEGREAQFTKGEIYVEYRNSHGENVREALNYERGRSRGGRAFFCKEHSADWSRRFRTTSIRERP